MTYGMFVLLLIWIAACTAKPEPKTFLGSIDTREPADLGKILAEYGKKRR